MADDPRPPSRVVQSIEGLGWLIEMGRVMAAMSRSCNWRPEFAMGRRVGPPWPPPPGRARSSWERANRSRRLRGWRLMTGLRW